MPLAPGPSQLAVEKSYGTRKRSPLTEITIFSVETSTYEPKWQAIVLAITSCPVRHRRQVARRASATPRRHADPPTSLAPCRSP